MISARAHIGYAGERLGGSTNEITTHSFSNVTVTHILCDGSILMHEYSLTILLQVPSSFYAR
jgi:hypothetical protein